MSAAREQRSRRRYVAPIVVGAVIIAALLVAGLAVQATLPKPYPLLRTERLPSAVTRSVAIVTNSDAPYDNAPLWWIRQRGRQADVFQWDPSRPHQPPDHLVGIHLPPGPKPAYDVGTWPPLRAPVLFAMQQEPMNLRVTVFRLDNGNKEASYVSPVAAPAPGETRDLMIATYEGKRPDLLVVDRGLETSRVRVRAISSESGFRRQLLSTSLPFRGLKPSEWSVDVGQIASKAGKNGNPKPRRPDLLLIDRDPDRKRASLKVMLGEEGFQGFASQRDLDTPADLGRRRSFLTGTSYGATVMFEIDRAGGAPRLKIFSLEPATGLL